MNESEAKIAHRRKALVHRVDIGERRVFAGVVVRNRRFQMGSRHRHLAMPDERHPQYAVSHHQRRPLA